MRLTIVMGFFLPVPPLAGGATEKIWSRLATEIAQRGHSVTVISRLWKDLPAREVLNGVTHIRLPGRDHTPSLARNLWRDFRWARTVLPALPPADVVVCNTVSLPLFLKRSRPDAGRVAVVLGRMPKGQVRAYGATDLLLATSEAVAERARQENPRLSSRLVLFPNPIDWSLHRRASCQESKSGPLEIGYVGRIHPEKGLEILLEAGCLLVKNKTLPDWRITLMGPQSIQEGGGGESYVASLRARFESQLGSRLRLLPPCYGAEALASVYGELNLFCYPSRAARGEGLSIAPLEAMAAGAVPVLSQLDCYRDIIEPGVNGLQFDQDSADAAPRLAHHFDALLGDATTRRTLAFQAQKSVERYDYQHTVTHLLHEFARLTPPSARL